jgi:hypothetical protein
LVTTSHHQRSFISITLKVLRVPDALRIDTENIPKSTGGYAIGYLIGGIEIALGTRDRQKSLPMLFLKEFQSQASALRCIL